MNATTYRFQLDKSSKKYLCPGCGKKRFVRYIETETGRLHPDENSGRCDREQHCQYHQYPDSEKQAWTPPPQPKPIVDIPKAILDCTIENHGVNNFITWLHGLFDPEAVEAVLTMYQIGTAGDWLTIPYITETGRIRAIQAKKFDDQGHTICTNWIHSILSREMKTLPDWIKPYQEQDLKVSTLFGAHLLKRYPTAPIGLVEAPKNAMICTLFYGMPGTLWLATYNKSTITEDRVKILKGRKVTVYPDLGAFDHWKVKAQQFGFGINDFIEKIATAEERKAGADIADFIIKRIEQCKN